MQCPICNNVNLVMSERQGIEIDYCPQCRGVWLDRGELDKIIDRTFQQSKHEQKHFHGHRDYDDKKYRDYGYKKKKRGFLGEIFDFD